MSTRQKGITWTTFIVMIALVITMSVNLIAEAGYDCEGCSNSCWQTCTGASCEELGSGCCGICKNDEGEIICICCFTCGVPI